MRAEKNEMQNRGENTEKIDQTNSLLFEKIKLASFIQTNNEKTEKIKKQKYL